MPVWSERVAEQGLELLSRRVGPAPHRSPPSGMNPFQLVQLGELLPPFPAVGDEPLVGHGATVFPAQAGLRGPALI